jgi:hypothetical protein
MQNLPPTADLIAQKAKLMAQLAPMKEIEKDIEAIDRILSMYGVNGSNDTVTPSDNTSIELPKVIPAYTTDVPEEYSPMLTWEDKCLFILKHGPMYANEVAKRIVKLDPDIRLDTAEERCAYNCSKLKSAGKLRAIAKSGKRFKYALN